MSPDELEQARIQRVISDYEREKLSFTPNEYLQLVMGAFPDWETEETSMSDFDGHVYNPPISFQEDCTDSGNLSAEEPRPRKLQDLKREGQELFYEAMKPWEEYFGVSARVLGMYGFRGLIDGAASFCYKETTFTIRQTARAYPKVAEGTAVADNTTDSHPYTPQQLLFAMIAQIENGSTG